MSNGVTQVLNTAFAKLPAPANSNCLPVAQGDPQSVAASYAFTSGNGLVDQNANELWSVLVCKPWLSGELGTTAYSPLGSGNQTVVDTYGRQLLWSQAIAANETPTTTLIQAKQATYTGIANSIQQNDPAVYALFQGNQWTTRLEIAFAAMFAALVAGMLILLIALTLIVLKLGFLLLLVAGPFFLIIGTHPGFGRIIAIRWFEMLVGVLMKQAAIAIVLSVLLYCYSLIMGTADTVLPWALKIIMIALVTVAVFIYRRPFTHLFSAVGYGTLGSAERADVSLREAGVTFRRNTMTAASVAVPGVAGARAARWARRNPGQAAAVAAGVTGSGRGRGRGRRRVGRDRGRDRGRRRLRLTVPRLRRRPRPTRRPSRAGPPRPGWAASRDVPEAGGGPSRTPPPLDLPPRNGGSAPARAASTWAGRGQGAAARGPAPSRSRATAAGTASGPAASAPVRSAPPASRSSAPGPAARPGSGGGPSSGGGSGSRPPAPSWPLSGSGGGSAAGPRQRPAAERRPAPSRPAPAPPAQSSPADPPAAGRGDTSGEPRAMPFWLRPRRK